MEEKEKNTAKNDDVKTVWCNQDCSNHEADFASPQSHRLPQTPHDGCSPNASRVPYCKHSWRTIQERYPEKGSDFVA